MMAIESKFPMTTLCSNHTWGLFQLAIAVLAVGTGTAMFSFPSVGPVGIPLVLLGVPLAVNALLRFCRSGQPQLRALIVGSILLAAAMFAIVVSNGQTALTVNRWLFADAGWNELVPRFLQMLTQWFVGPTIAAVALRLRQPELGTPLLTVWLLLVLAGPLTGLATLLLGVCLIG